MTSRYRRAVAGLCTVAALTTAGLGCSSNEGEQVNESLTSDESRNRTTDYLEQSLAALPPGSRLDRVHPDLPLAELAFGRFAPCYDSNTVADGPHYFAVKYWVVGGEGPAGLRALVDRWNEWGFAVDDRTANGDNYAQGTSPDDYLLTATLSTDGYLSLGGSSPCFPYDNGTDLDSRSTGVIEQP